MEKNKIFTFTAPNGTEVTAIAISKVAYEVDCKDAVERWLCYAQNRLFTYEESHPIYKWDAPHKFKYGKAIVDYCTIPEYDTILEAEQQKFNDECYEALSSIGDMDVL